MQPQIIGISGSPIKKSNTDRVVQAVLESSGLKSEFVKLSRINVRPCIACLGCKKDNICKPKDDFQELAEKVRHAGAVVVGGYAPYGAVAGYTDAVRNSRPFANSKCVIEDADFRRPARLALLAWRTGCTQILKPINAIAFGEKKANYFRRLC